MKLQRLPENPGDSHPGETGAGDQQGAKGELHGCDGEPTGGMGIANDGQLRARVAGSRHAGQEMERIIPGR